MTRTYSLPYGKNNLQIKFDKLLAIDLYLPVNLTSNSKTISTVLTAIRNPLNNVNLPVTMTEKTTVAITINDKTRPVPNNLLFPPLLEFLQLSGVKKENILIIIATGTHAPMPENEFDMLLKTDILKEFRIISHNCDDDANLTYKGTTSYGTPVLVNSFFDQADIKIVVGNIEPHHFAGFSGGFKSASIGLAGRKTINHNHALLQDPKSGVGRYEDNPLRQDIEEIGDLMGVDLALNVILNENKEILHVFFGHPKDVIKAGIRIIHETELINIDEPYDLVIASAGGYPKDINLYQAQKALTHASLFCKKDGLVILAAACNEGVGHQGYVDFMRGVTSHAEARDKLLKNGFEVGPHKAFQFALLAEKINFQIKTEIDESIMNGLLLKKIDDLQDAINRAICNCTTPPRIAIVPFATATIPKVSGG
jgi:nickel-dependent lactate racemase